MPTSDKQPVMTRRAMLLKLGLGATAAYAAPTLLRMDEARASGPSRPSRGSRGSRGGSYGRSRDSSRDTV